MVVFVCWCIVYFWVSVCACVFLWLVLYLILSVVLVWLHFMQKNYLYYSKHHRQSCSVCITCSSLNIDTLRRYEPDKFSKAAEYIGANADTVSTVLYFNKGL